MPVGGSCCRQWCQSTQCHHNANTHADTHLADLIHLEHSQDVAMLGTACALHLQHQHQQQIQHHSAQSCVRFGCGKAAARTCLPQVLKAAWPAHESSTAVLSCEQPPAGKHSHSCTILHPCCSCTLQAQHHTHLVCNLHGDGVAQLWPKVHGLKVDALLNGHVVEHPAHVCVAAPAATLLSRLPVAKDRSPGRRTHTQGCCSPTERRSSPRPSRQLLLFLELLLLVLLMIACW